MSENSKQWTNLCLNHVNLGGQHTGAPLRGFYQFPWNVLLFFLACAGLKTHLLGQHGCAAIILSLSHLCLNKDVLDSLPDCQLHIFDHQAVIFKKGRSIKSVLAVDWKTCLAYLIIFYAGVAVKKEPWLLMSASQSSMGAIFELKRSLKHDLWSHLDTIPPLIQGFSCSRSNQSSLTVKQCVLWILHESWRLRNRPSVRDVAPPSGQN